MKKTTFFLPLFATLFFLVSCVEQINQPSFDNDSVVSNNTAKTKSIIRDLETGINQSDIENYLLVYEHISSDELKNITRFEICEDAYVFIVNRKDGHWYLFSGDYSSAPILSEGEKGGTLFETPLSRHDKMWLESIENEIIKNRHSDSEFANSNRHEWIRANQIAMLIKNPRIITQRDGEPDTMDLDIEIITDTIYYEHYPSLTITEWHQDAPWNNQVPKFNNNYRCLAGCTVIAIAQLLYYTHFAFGYPDYIYGSASCNNVYTDNPYSWSYSNYTNTSWDCMSIEHYNAYTWFDPYMPALCAMIADKSGTRYEYEPDTQYDYTETYGNTKVDSVVTTLNYFSLTGASCLNYNTNIDLIRNEIQHDRPVLCAGLDSDGPNSNTIGHAFLIDGYHRHRITETVILRDMTGSIISQDTHTYQSFYWCINTGNPSTYHIFDPVAGGVYYATDRIVFIGWGQSW